jgi:hypothetical protein
VLRETRWQFWRNLLSMYRHNPGGVSSYLSVCAQIEHFIEYRVIVKEQIEEQLQAFLAEEAKLKEVAEDAKTPVSVRV